MLPAPRAGVRSSDVGVIVAAGDAATVTEAGADYVEPTIVGNVTARDDDGTWGPNPDYDQPAAGSFAVLFPGDIRISDPAFPPEQVTDYLERTLAAVGAVATPGALIVLGSGAARTVPEGVDTAAARRRFAEVVVQARDIAARHDLRIVLEPLNHGETNLITSIAEAVEFLDEHGIDGVPVVADLYHIMEVGEPLAVVAAHAHRIGHVHLADTGRIPPGQGDWPAGELVRSLREHGYDGTLTIECRWRDLAAELPDALAHVRSLDTAG